MIWKNKITKERIKIYYKKFQIQFAIENYIQTKNNKPYFNPISDFLTYSKTSSWGSACFIK